MGEYTTDNTGKIVPKPLRSFTALSKEEQEEFIKRETSAGRLPRVWNVSQADRLYKNQQFKQKYGKEVYKALTNKNSENYIPAEARDELFNRDEYSKAISSRFANDPGLDYYTNLTTEGLKDLWDSGIMSSDEIKAEEERLNSLRKSNNKYKPKSKLLAAFINAGKEETPSSLKDLSDAVAYSRGIINNKEEEERISRNIENQLQESKDKAEGVVSYGMEDKDVDSSINRLHEQNTKKIQAFQMREDERILNLPQVQEEAKRRADSIYQKINDEQLTYEEVRNTFKEVFDNDTKEDASGSRYYTGYKNRKELANFGIDDMIQALSEFSVLSDAYGDASKAMQTIDTKIFNIAKDNQGFWRRRANTLRGVASKANSMLVGEVFGGYVDLWHAATDNPKEYKQYKTAEGVLTKGDASFLVNPNYWNYVDQYGIWDPYEIQRINDNNGIGGRMNLYSPDGKMTGEQFVDESFKMLGYMLPAVALSAATKKVPRTSPWAKAIAGAEILGSAAALGSAYSSGTYNEITLSAEQALDKMFNEESSEFIKQYYKEHPDFIKNYFIAQGVKQDDSDLITIPTQLAAERAFYQEAKEAYFNTHEGRREAYEEAQNRILKDAQLGASWDNYIETARMTVSNAFWGKWTKSQLTRDMLNRNLNPVRVYGDVAKQVGSKGAAAGKAAAMTLLNGGVDNWLDDITAGVGKGLGLGDYNNYLGSVYGPDATVESSKYAANIIDGMIWGRQGAEEAFYNPQTWIDGAIGAAGSVFGTRINAITLIRDMIKGENAFSKGDAKEEWRKNNTAWQRLNRYVTNGITTSIADAHALYDRTEEEVERINTEVIPKYKEDLNTLGNFLLETYSFDEMADNVLASKDIKQITMLKSAVRVLDAMNDPVLAQLPAVQEFASMLNRGREGNFTNSEIQSFINDPNNINIKNATDSDGKSISESMAVEAMQKNINNFLKIADKYNELSKGLSKNSKFASLGPEVKTQLAVQLALRDVWQERLGAMQETLGTKGTEKSRWDYAAEFGSEEGKQTIIGGLEKYINKKKEQRKIFMDKLATQQEAFELAETPEDREAAYKELTKTAYVVDYYNGIVAESTALLNEKKKANVAFDENGNARTLTSEEIMRLSPKQRAEMLNPANIKRYSPEQQRIIKELSDNLKNSISPDASTVQDLYQMVLDAGEMSDRLEESNKSIRKVSENPFMLKEYATRLKERQAYMLLEAAMREVKNDQIRKLDEITSPEEAIDVIFRGKHPANATDKGFYIPADVVDEYIENHPEATEKLSTAREMVRTLDDLFASADDLFEPTEAQTFKEIIASSVKNTNSKEEMLSSLEDIMDKQTDSNVKLQFDRLLENMKSLGYQRDATKVRNRELERQRKAEEDAKLKAQEEERKAKMDGKNYGWEGYKVGDTVYTDGDSKGTVIGFEGTTRMRVKYESNGTSGSTYFDSTTDIDKARVSKEAPAEAPKEAPEGSVPAVEVEEVPESRNPLNPAVVQVGSEEVEISPEGQVNSPSAEKQAKLNQTTVVKVPKQDPTDQGNVIDISSVGLLPGNRWVEYSVEKLKDGIVEREQPTDKDSVFGKFIEWLDNNNIKLQEIIDEEFSRIILDNPDIDIRFMLIPRDKSNKLSTVMFNVIELTPQMRQKYHDESRGGVIQANGKTWLVVGTTGFESKATREQREAYDRMKGPINGRRDAYFSSNPNEYYYVDQVAYSRVQNTTSGRIVNQKLGESAPRLKRVSELLKASGKTLRQAVFAIQTKDVGEKNFAKTKNVGDESNVFPPRNNEDNLGRTFILIDAPNGNRIPGMIEPAMFRDLPEGSPLKELINKTISQLFTTNYEMRKKAISELCGFLVLNDNKNILVGNENFDAITIRRRNAADITQKLGKDFDIAKFLKDVEEANFQVNITLSTLEDDAFFLPMYDESGALMTTVDSMRTAGMSYTIYMTDKNGKPIMSVPVGNAVPGSGKYQPRVTRTERVNNTTYDFKNGQWESRATGDKVEVGSKLETSILCNEIINSTQRDPIYTKEGIAYYSIPYNGAERIVSRDGLNNIEVLSEAESKTIKDEIQSKLDEQERINNFDEVVLDEEVPQTPITPNEPVGQITQEQINQQAIGNFTATETVATPEATKEVVKEAKESQPTEPKEVITSMGNKSLSELQKKEKLSTFASIAADFDYIEKLYEILESKDWGITGDFGPDEEILKAHNVPVEGISDIEKWLELIRDCR